MKSIILVAGEGMRMGKIGRLINKCMLELAGKSLLEYNLEHAVEIEEITEIIIVVGYKKDEIIKRWGENYRGKKIRYITQLKQRGSLDAIWSCKEAIRNEDFFLLFGNEVLLDSKHKEMYSNFKKENLFGVCGVCITYERDKMQETYGIIEKQNRVTKAVGKPKNIITNIQGTGHCIFRAEIFSYIEELLRIKDRREKMIADLIQFAVNEGKEIKIFPVCKKLFHIHTGEDLKEAEKILSSNFFISLVNELIKKMNLRLN